MRAQDDQVTVLFLRHLNDDFPSNALCHYLFHLNRRVFGDQLAESVENVGVGRLRLRRHQAEFTLDGFLRLLDIKQDQARSVVAREGQGNMKRICCQVGKVRRVQDSFYLLHGKTLG